MSGGPFCLIKALVFHQTGPDDLVHTTDGLLDQQVVPKSPVGKGPYAGLYFVGFDNYKLGGILGTIRTDSETIVNHLMNR